MIKKKTLKETLIAQKASITEWATIESKLLKEANVVIKDKDLADAFSNTLGAEE